MRRARAVVAADPTAIIRAASELAKFTFATHPVERDAQLLFEMFPHLNDTAAHELFPQERFTDSVDGVDQELPADLVRVSELGDSDRTPMITELKLSNMRWIVNKGRRTRLSADGLDAIAQARDYQKLARENIVRAEQRYGRSLNEVTAQVIGGRTLGLNKEILAQIREDYRELTLRGYDEVLLDVLRRWDL